MNLLSHPGMSADDMEKFHGRMAAIPAKPIELYSEKIKHLALFEGRYFAQAPACPQEVYQPDNPALLVGAGPITAGQVDDMYVRDDVVHALVNSGDAPGIYYSQALFDHLGRIRAWTAWQPKALIADADVMNVHMMRTVGCLQISTPQDVKRTSWIKLEDDSLCGLVNKEFRESPGGIHELIDFPKNTPGLNNNGAVAILGSHKMMLADAHEPFSALILNDDLLHSIAPLATAEIVADNHHGWLFIGGVHGLEIVGSRNGAGWNIDSSSSCIDQLKHGMRSQHVGDYRFVRKIIADYPYVYILTDTELDRIDIDASDFARGTVHATRLATIRDFAHFGIFKDLLVSGKFALLSTSDQLYRVANGNDISTDNQHTLRWTPVEIPGAAGPVNHIIGLSVSGRMQDVARASAGTIYLVTGSPGKNVSHVYRGALTGVQDWEISDTTFMLIRDLNTADIYKPFINVGNYSPCFATDGTFTFTKAIARRYKIKKEVLVNNCASQQSASNHRSAIPLALENDASIACIARNSTLGNWMVGGNFGLFINE